MPALSFLRPRRLCSALCLTLSVAAASGSSGSAQAVPVTPVSTVLALTPFQQKALLAFAPSGAVFGNLTLTGTVDRTAGSLRESGSITLHSSADGSSKETWLGAGENREIACTNWSDGHACTISLKGKTKELGGISDQRAMSWFAPWAGLPALSSQIAVATETQDSSGDEVLTFTPYYGSSAGRSPAKQKQLAEVAKAASVSVLFDAATGLASGMRYTDPLSSDSSNAIDVSIVYSDYRLEQGFMVPHRIQRYLQRTLESDIHITGVSLS